ncbi:XRE family transcriptional regulator [bacterium]|nr:MAG: XRE family transcriptional regulator [bacterium]
MPSKHLQPGDEERRRAVGAKIRTTRTEGGIGLRELARDLGMSPSWLLGATCSTSPTTLSSGNDS